MIKTVGPLALAFFIALLGTPLVRNFALRIKAVDRPEARKVHNSLMPRLGGLAICLGFWASMLLTQELTREIWGILAGGLAIVLVGMWDDIRGVSPKVKLLVQILAALIVLQGGIKVEFLTNPFGDVIVLDYFSYPLTVLWIIGITNAVNLIDGLDGLAAGVSAIAAITLGVVSLLEGQGGAALPAFILAAAIFGFLRYNIHPARIFMGDTGSLFLGFNLATLAIVGLTKSTAVISIFLPVVILGIPIFDTLSAILRRFINGKPIFSADKEHIHHRLLELGLSHGKTVFIIYCISGLLGVSAVLMALVSTGQGMLIMAVLSLGFFIIAEKVGIFKGSKARAQARKDKKAYHHAAK